MFLKWTGSKNPILKIAYGGRFKLKSDSYLFQHIKLRTFTKLSSVFLFAVEF